jgi:hypothetical protein
MKVEVPSKCTNAAATNTHIGKNVKILHKVGARTSALKALEALEKLGTTQIIHLKILSSFKQLKTHIS